MTKMTKNCMDIVKSTIFGQSREEGGARELGGQLNFWIVGGCPSANSH